jgi:hypothetical protein
MCICVYQPALLVVRQHQSHAFQIPCHVGQSAAPSEDEDVLLHFVTFVHKDGACVLLCIFCPVCVCVCVCVCSKCLNFMKCSIKGAAIEVVQATAKVCV